MAKGAISEVGENTQRRTKNKVRKVLQTLQVPADEQVVTKKNMVNPTDKALPCKEKARNVEKIKLTEKENAISVRRSKRKVAPVTVNYAESPDISKTTKSGAKTTLKSKKTVKSKKGCPIAVKKSEQTKLNFPPVATNTTLNENPKEFESDKSEKLITSTTEITEDSGFDPTCGVSVPSPINSTFILASSSSSSAKSSVLSCNDISIITGDIPTLSYWRDLAEQRRTALEKALHENELLHDQLTVLEAENSQLKQLVREAENLAQVVRAIVE